MAFIDPTDPMDFFLWEEFLETDSQWECPNCGKLFGNESVAWDEEDGCVTFVCPGCGCTGQVES
jgi:hypothetical protein